MASGDCRALTSIRSGPDLGRLGPRERSGTSPSRDAGPSAPRSAEGSLGRPHVGEDPWIDEYVAVTVDAVPDLKGEPVERVVLGWDAIQVDPDGNRVATILSNGIRPPEVGDRMLLFLDPASPIQPGGG